ncbi:MAG TPA: hydrogenase nickel incorporation protein HypB [Thermoanaerobaculia bacterium]|nr:hydrogenase nickel incorporation protein HypB [Thermoanaerobaculia bacterium]
MNETVVDVQKRVLSDNDRIAEELRQSFSDRGILVANLISSPGSGKTTLLESSIPSLVQRCRVAVLEGDIETERDADRLRSMGVPAYQILTGGACHLDARQIARALSDADLGQPDLLFIENVGNLICPTSYDLGEDFKVALLSVTEGDDKPFKYPAIFSAANVTVITKSDLLAHVRFDLEAVKRQIRTLRPDGSIFLTSSTGGIGIDSWVDYLLRCLETKRTGS